MSSSVVIHVILGEDRGQVNHGFKYVPKELAIRKNNSNLSVVDIEASSQRRLSQGNYTFSANGIKDLKLSDREEEVKKKQDARPSKKETS